MRGNSGVGDGIKVVAIDIIIIIIRKDCILPAPAVVPAKVKIKSNVKRNSLKKINKLRILKLKDIPVTLQKTSWNYCKAKWKI